jgi:hypothetical protein
VLLVFPSVHPNACCSSQLCPSSLIEIFFFFFVFSFESGICFLERLFVLKLLFF